MTNTLALDLPGVVAGLTTVGVMPVVLLAAIISVAAFLYAKFRR